MTDATHAYTTYIHTTAADLWTALTTPDATRRYFDFMEGFMAVDSAWLPGAPITYRAQGAKTTRPIAPALSRCP